MIFILRNREEAELSYLSNLGVEIEIMKKKKTAMRIIIVIVFCLITVILTVYAIIKCTEEKKGLTFYLLEEGRFASGWMYELSNDNVLEEVDMDVYDCFYDRYNYWEFRPKAGASGEVTIYFIAQCKTVIVEEDCFSITYYVDENGNVTEISSENKPDKVNYYDDIAGLAWLKSVDFLTKYIDGKISFIIDAEYMRLFRSN